MRGAMCGMLVSMSATQFAVRTSHRTYLAADPSTGALRHVADGPDGTRVLAHWFGEDSCILSRRDGGALSIAVANTELVVPLLPFRLVTDADRSRVALRHIAGTLLTAVPDGRVVHDRRAIADWELFTLEPDGGGKPAIAAVFDDDRALERFCDDPANDPSSIAGLLALMPARRRGAILTSLAARADYPTIFGALRLVLAGGQERGAWHTRSHLQVEIDAHSWQIGDHTYGNPTVVDAQNGSLSIGRYCSIAAGVQIIVSDQPVGAVTTYPFAALHQFWPSTPDDLPHDRAAVVIGNNVSIGQGATVLPGATIGDGAVIGAGSVVAGPVAPYAIAAGNPARVKRIRFDKSVVGRLLAVRWWDWPDELVDRHVPLLLSGDVVGFLDVAEREVGRLGA